MGFARQGLWVTGYCRLMGYGLQIPAHQLGGPKMAWDFRGYGLSEAWVKRVSTVVTIMDMEQKKKYLYKGCCIRDEAGKLLEMKVTVIE